MKLNILHLSYLSSSYLLIVQLGSWNLVTYDEYYWIVICRILETTMKNSPPTDMSDLSNVPDLTLNITNSHVEGTMDKLCNGTLPMCAPSSLFDLSVYVLKMFYRLIFLLSNKNFLCCFVLREFEMP